MSQLILVRHGQSEWNQQNLFTGWRDPDLTERGVTEARNAGIYGTLRMLVSLKKDGTIKEVAILQSSGSTVLDDAAIRIVRMASPFAPFPDEMRKEVDELEIIRTWSFQRRGLTSG